MKRASELTTALRAVNTAKLKVVEALLEFHPPGSEVLYYIPGKSRPGKFLRGLMLTVSGPDRVQVENLDSGKQYWIKVEWIKGRPQ